MPKHKVLLWCFHGFGALGTGVALFLCVGDPLSSFKAREFRHVTVQEVNSETYAGRNLVLIKTSVGGTEWVSVPLNDAKTLRPGTSVWLMTADFYIKGPTDQRITLFRLMRAYPWIWGWLYPIAWLVRLVWTRRKPIAGEPS